MFNMNLFSIIDGLHYIKVRLQQFPMDIQSSIPFISQCKFRYTSVVSQNLIFPRRRSPIISSIGFWLSFYQYDLARILCFLGKPSFAHASVFNVLQAWLHAAKIRAMTLFGDKYSDILYIWCAQLMWKFLLCVVVTTPIIFFQIPSIVIFLWVSELLW